MVWCDAGCCSVCWLRWFDGFVLCGFAGFNSVVIIVYIWRLCVAFVVWLLMIVV